MLSLHVIRSPPSTRKSIPVTIATTTNATAASTNGIGTTSPTTANAGVLGNTGALSPPTNVRHRSRSPTPQVASKNGPSANHHTVAFADEVQVQVVYLFIYLLLQTF